MAVKKEAKNDLQLLKEDLRAKQAGRLYIFHGEETFLLHHYLEQLKKLLLDELTESFNFHKLTSETFDIRSFADSVENLPMMAEHTLVWVDEVDIFKIAESDRDKMGEILSDIPDYCTVVFTYVTTPWKPDKRLTNYWKLISGKASIVEFAKQDQRELVPWIQRHFTAHKKKITPDLCVYLIELTGGTMTALGGEISKIAAFSGAENITRNDIDAVVEPIMDAIVFQMTDLLGRGEYGAALVKLQVLLKMQQEPIQILGAVGGHFRRLATAKTLKESGRGYQDFMQLTGLKSEFAAKKNMGAAMEFSSDFYRKAAALVMETDRKMKTSFDSGERLLELLILQLAQEARHG